MCFLDSIPFKQTYLSFIGSSKKIAKPKRPSREQRLDNVRMKFKYESTEWYSRAILRSGKERGDQEFKSILFWTLGICDCENPVFRFD